MAACPKKNKLQEILKSWKLIGLVVPPCWNRNEDPHHNGRAADGTDDGLEADRILNLPQRGLLDPYLPVKDFADNVTFLVLRDPRLVFVAVPGTEAIKPFTARVESKARTVVVGEELPWPKMTVVHAVQDLETLSLGRKNESPYPLTTHMPFQAAISVAIPIMNPTADSTRQLRLALLKVVRIAVMRPAIIPAMPRPRAKVTRGRLPLQIVQRTKLG